MSVFKAYLNMALVVRLRNWTSYLYENKNPIK